MLLLARLMAPSRLGERLKPRGLRHRDIALPNSARLFGRIVAAAAILGLVAVITVHPDRDRQGRQGQAPTRRRDPPRNP
ncbi:hypothetical protein [Streptomyces sp. NPDC088746]|uniref:hypothetical protein n=1 Tax=Streptomyces sp. NPDC088746 TaxID=3365885 RepID=UPI00380E9181